MRLIWHSYNFYVFRLPIPIQGHQYLALQVISKSNFDNFPLYFLIIDTFKVIIRLSDNRGWS